MMNEHDVNILIPPAQDESDDITITGPRENVAQAINGLNKRVDEIEADNEDKVCDFWRKNTNVRLCRRIVPPLPPRKK